MGLLRRKEKVADLGPATLLPAGDPGCWLVRTPASAPATVHLPVDVPAQVAVAAPVAPAVAFEADPEPVLAPPADETPSAVPTPRPARARLAALTANLSA
ncbi:MAG TPA: hypothetical protein VHE83_14440 [Mycobacteriales bacterium]|nr:hypothetical protein [Mycobacteriales bacterium]